MTSFPQHSAFAELQKGDYRKARPNLSKEYN